ncbi:hypothetical protein [Pseudomonas nitroreducens]|uniref:hypothetical protein n=1 Tax=Pseudomonas nitroreducens TaxID=46680 RepID=UPI003CC81D13
MRQWRGGLASAVYADDLFSMEGSAVGLSRPNQQLRRELREIAAQSDEAACLVGRIARALPDGQFVELMSAVTLMYDCVDRAKVLAERVKAGEVQASS